MIEAQGLGCRWHDGIPLLATPHTAHIRAGEIWNARRSIEADLGYACALAGCLGLGTLYAKLGQREQARAELVTAIDLYRAMGMTFRLPQAEAALAQVDGV
jgi:hypothetical protein